MSFKLNAAVGLTAGGIPTLLRKPFSPGRFMLTIDGHPSSDYVKSVEGGLVKANLIEEPMGPDNLRIKHLSTAEVEPISMETGVVASVEMIQWIKSSWNKKHGRRNGMIAYSDFNAGVQFEQEFYDALITEVQMPTLDGAGKDGVFIKLKIQPERVELRRVPMGPPAMGFGDFMQKSFATSSFRFIIDGIDTAGASKIENIQFKQGVKPVPCGRHRLPQYEPTKIEFSDFSVHFSMNSADHMLKWYKDSVIKGKREDGTQRTGAIEFLDPSKRFPLFRISLDQVGVKNASLSKSESNADGTKRVKFDFFCGRMDIDHGGFQKPPGF
jgi:hypothetical protein